MDQHELTDEELKTVSGLARRQYKLERILERLEHRTKLFKEKLNEVRDRDLPNALAECGLSEFTLSNGYKLKVKKEVYASITEERAPAAFAWLREHEFGGIIKNIISAEFGKGEDEKAIEAATVLAEAGFKPIQKESVHPMTLKAFIKEQDEKNSELEAEGKPFNELPLDLFGAFIVNRAKIEVPKK